MGMDRNLKNSVGQFSQAPTVNFEELLKTDYGLLFRREILLYFTTSALMRVTVKCLSCFGQHTPNSPSQCSFKDLLEKEVKCYHVTCQGYF